MLHRFFAQILWYWLCARLSVYVYIVSHAPVSVSTFVARRITDVVYYIECLETDFACARFSEPFRISGPEAKSDSCQD